MLSNFLTSYRKYLPFLLLPLSPVLTAYGQSSAQVYKVPPSGKVTFMLQEQWWEEKNVRPGGKYLGDALVTVQYLDGSKQTIVFLGSSDFLQLKIEFTGNRGSSTWSQAADLRPDATFSIVSAQPADAVNAYDPVAGNHFGGGYITGSVARVASSASIYSPPGAAPTPSSSPIPVAPSRSIHALIISGRSDPAKIVTSPNVTLIGGVVALGKNASSSAKPSSWSPGLRIVPDQNLLTGSKIPPLTPNVIDVRIVKHEVVGDLSIPSASPSP
jgi:hypothetical protein